MRSIVLDTNCLLQALPTQSPYHKIWTEVMAGHISLCVNSDILNEYEEILSQKTTAEIARNVIKTIIRLNTTVFQQVYYHFGLIETDPDDNKFVDCAFAAGADYLVSEDSHFNVLRTIPFPQLHLVTLDEFMTTDIVNHYTSE
jgi:putative PIN family toxin of toxin-antitoxin system